MIKMKEVDISMEGNDTSSDVLMCITKDYRTEKGLEISAMLAIVVLFVPCIVAGQNKNLSGCLL
jgi:hypothetical protein